MAFTIRSVEYYYANVRDELGAAYRVLSQLAELGVNLLAFTAVPSGPGMAQFALFPEDHRPDLLALDANGRSSWSRSSGTSHGSSQDLQALRLRGVRLNAPSGANHRALPRVSRKRAWSAATHRLPRPETEPAVPGQGARGSWWGLF
jgi:hypothetical protein